MSATAVTDLVQLDDDAWDDALSTSGRPFRFSHRAVAGRAFERAYPSYRFEAYRVTYADGTAALCPLVRVARRLNSLTDLLGMPLSMEGTPVALDGGMTGNHVRGLFEALGGRGSLRIYGGAGGSPPRVDGATSGVTHTLDLRPGFEVLWRESFSGKSRNSCRKAERAGVEVRRMVGREASRVYYGLYEAATRTWGYSRPPYPRELIDGVLESDAAEVWLAYLEERPIGGALMLRGSEDLFYWSGAMDRAFQGLAPSNAVLRAAIESACERGLTYLDFGSSTGMSGVEKFKASFGAAPRDFCNVEVRSLSHRALEWWRIRAARGAPSR